MILFYRSHLSNNLRFTPPKRLWYTRLYLQRSRREASIAGKGYRINEQIRVREVRVIDAAGEQKGIMPTAQALQSAIELGIDLVEVAPTAAPPVCRLMDYGRFRYDQTKKDRESKRSQHTAILREMRFRPNIASHDRDAKLRRTRELLEAGNKVKLTVVFRGREITHQELCIGLLRGIAESLREVAKLEAPPNFEGRHMSILVAPLTKREPNTAEKSETQET